MEAGGLFAEACPARGGGMLVCAKIQGVGSCSEAISRYVSGDRKVVDRPRGNGDFAD